MLTRWNNWSDWPAFGFGRTSNTFEDLRREMDRLLFDFGRDFAEPQRFAGPRVGIKDTGTAFVLSAELPGLTENEIDLTINANTVTLRAERKAEQPEGYSAHRRERPAFTVSRTYEFPSKVDPERAEASLKNGVLTVTIQKAPDAQPKRIAVKAN